ncbi:MAG TPA: hypothetical protein EYQ40_05675, partial [Candidatus Marinimicrobia bacterium]|nr:hypothetical protein [Candidatus Neomarinimicrobiota bacterium]
MKKIIFLFNLFVISAIYGDIYSDRMLVYIDNSVANFQVDENTGRTNLEELNQKLDDLDAEKIRQWLPNARPTDRDGDIYLNRYYVIELSSPRMDVELLSSIRFSETMGINRPDYTPNDPLWNNQYYLGLIEADHAYDLWDIDGGEIPGQMSEGEMVVGIVDNALDWDHSDLVGNLWQNLGEDADGDGMVIVQSGNTWIFDPGDENGVDDDNDGYIDNFIGWDVAFNDNDPVPPNSQYDHGTTVSGCVSAVTNNNNGIASVGWSVKLMGINSTDDPGFVTHGYNGILAAAQ